MNERQLDGKFELGSAKKTKVIISICIIALIILFIITGIDILIGTDKFLIKIISGPICILCICSLFYYFNLLNSKIEIKNNEIIKHGLFNKIKKIGQLSDMEAFSGNIYVSIYQKEKKLFSFWKTRNNKDNETFYEYLKSNCTQAIVINSHIFIAILILLYLIFFIYAVITVGNIMGILISIFMILGLMWLLKITTTSFKIIGEQVIYTTLFSKRKIDLVKITRIKYIKKESISRYGRIISYNIEGFINDEKCFKARALSKENFECLKSIAKLHKIKLTKNK